MLKHMNDLSDKGTLLIEIPIASKLQNFIVDLQEKEAQDFAGNFVVILMYYIIIPPL